MKTAEAVRTAIFATVRNTSLGDIRSFGEHTVDKLQDLSTQLESPTSGHPLDHMMYAILKQDAPYDERKQHAQTALRSAKDQALQALSYIGGIDLSEVTQKSQEFSKAVIDDTIQAATIYPKKADTRTSRQTVMQALNPNQESIQDIAISASFVYELLEPYLIKRLLAIEIYQTHTFKDQLAEIASDIDLLSDFYGSVEHIIQLFVEGKTSVSNKELAEGLFGIGPIAVKILQVSADAVPTPSPETKQVFKVIKKALQENIALPKPDELREIESELPAGLTLKSAISSASVAHIVAVDSPEGELATKVERPGLDQALARNIRLYQVLSDVLISFVHEHAGDSPLASTLTQFEKIMPFLLSIVSEDIVWERDFTRQMAAQNRGETAVKNHKGIIFPSIHREYSDPNHITMKRVDATRIEDLPANVAYLKNIFVLCFALWKDKFWHSDLHGGNIKGKEDGSIVPYDWGQSFEIPLGFVSNLGRYLFALARKDPKATAKAYCRIQSQDYPQVSIEEVELIAKEVFESRRQNSSSESGPKRVMGIAVPHVSKEIMKELGLTQQMLTFALALRHQNIMDMRYLKFLRSMAELKDVIEGELSKPSYTGKSDKAAAVIKACITAALENIRV